MILLFSTLNIIFAQVNRPPGGPQPNPGDAAAGMGVMLAMCACWGVFALLFGLVPLIGLWKAFAKAGEPGWAAIVPYYNVIVMTKIAGLEIMHAILAIFVPFYIIKVVIDFAKAYGKGTGFAIGLCFMPFIFFPMLGFGDAKFTGAGGKRRRRRDDDDDDDEDDEDDDDEEDARPAKKPVKKPLRDEDDDDEEEEKPKPKPKPAPKPQAKKPPVDDDDDD